MKINENTEGKYRFNSAPFFSKMFKVSQSLHTLTQKKNKPRGRIKTQCWGYIFFCPIKDISSSAGNGNALESTSSGQRSDAIIYDTASSRSQRQWYSKCTGGRQNEIQHELSRETATTKGL